MYSSHVWSTTTSDRRRAIGCALLSGAAALFACRDVTSPAHTASIPSRPSRLLNTSGVVIVSPRNMHGWTFYDDQHDSTCTVAAVCQFVNGPSGQPLGGGSAELATPLSGDGKALLLRDYVGTRLDRVTDLHYSTYRQSSDAGNNLAIALQFNVDYDLTDTVRGSRPATRRDSDPAHPPRPAAPAPMAGVACGRVTVPAGRDRGNLRLAGGLRSFACHP